MNVESTSYGASHRCNLLILSPGFLISDRLSGCPLPPPFSPRLSPSFPPASRKCWPESELLQRLVDLDVALEDLGEKL